MFFDHLGPPWPKHPCTDSGSITLPVWAPSSHVSLQSPSGAEGWSALDALSSDQVGDKERVRLDRKTTRLPSEYLYLPSDFARGQPCYWRRCEDEPGEVELSTFQLDQDGSVCERRICVPAWIRNDDHLETLADDRCPVPDLEALNEIGRSISLDWRKDRQDTEWYLRPEVNLPVARTYFQSVAAVGRWQGWFNLARIAMWGPERDMKQAFRFVEKAAGSLDPTALKALAAFYRNGLGVEKNEDQANFLNELSKRVIIQDGSDRYSLDLNLPLSQPV